MAPAFSGVKTLRALSTLTLLSVASATELFNESLFDSVEDEAVCFMQSYSALKSGPRQLLSDAAIGGGFDAITFAQTSLEVASVEASTQASDAEVVDEEPPAADVQPAWLAEEQAEVQQPNEDMTCSKEGLTPGVCAMVALARPAPAAKPEDQADLDFANVDRLERALFQELEAALAGTHTGFSADHLAEVERELSGFFAALPKNEAGNLDHPTVRYAIHQRFLRKHAWYIRSLNPVGEAQTPASPGEALRGQVPEHLQKLIERRQEGKGLGLRELAALAATLEHLIQGDLVERVKAAYVAHGLAPNSTTSRSDVAEAMKTYMAHFLSLAHKSGYAVTPEEARKELLSIETGYSGWPSVVANIKEAVGKRLPEAPEASLPFSEAMAAGKEVMDKFEAVSAKDCQDIKGDLTRMPNGASGNVLLSDLHRKALDGSMLFAESTEYLATLGALDEAEDGAVTVLVPNYVYSPSNCLGTTSFFDMCCPNECEVIMEQLETQLRKSDVTPAEVEGVIHVARPDAPLDEGALQELDDLAHARGGRVPLHGYFFAHWMHRTFPGECPKPHYQDFAGARGAAGEVPAGQEEYQGVAKLSFIAASRSDLLAELEQEEQKQVSEPLPSNASQVAGAVGGDLRIDQLKAIAAQKMGTGGLKARKVASGLDAASLAQTRLDVSPAAAEEAGPQEEAQAAAGASGLNVRRLP